MIVLSLFDGISCGRVALGDRVTEYYASEIDKHAMRVSASNWPDIIQLGDVRAVRHMVQLGLITHVDMLIGGSPCTDLSFAGKQAGLQCETLEDYKALVAADHKFTGQSFLFWEFVWIKDLLKPRWFLLENVKMKKESLEIFNRVMGVEPVFIDSALVSAQTRKRYYWCNWSVSQPEDRGVSIGDIIDESANDPMSDGWHSWWKKNSDFQLKKRYSAVLQPEDKAICMTARQYSSYNGNFTGCRMLGRRINPNTGRRDDYNLDIEYQQLLEVRRDNKIGTITTVQKDTMVTCDGKFRKLTPIECERLMGLKDGYTAAASESQRYKMLGNGWQVDTIKHIFEGLPR